MALLEVKNLHTYFKTRKGIVKAVNDVSYALEPGKTIGIVGESGCGKSTLLQLVAGFLKPKSGIILNQACKISYAFQEPRLFPWLTVTENLRAVLSDKDTADSRIADALDTVSLSDAAHLYPDELSGGMKSRASLARALAYGGDLYLLDEPFAGVDPIAVIEIQRIIRFLKNRGIGVLITDHNVRETLGICDHAYIICDGTVLASGHPKDIVQNEAVRRAYLGEAFRM